MGWNTMGPFTTINAKKKAYWHTTFKDALFVGPIAVVANIFASNSDYGDNFGKLTVGDLAVEAIEGNSNEPGALWPVSFKYTYTITNDDASPLVFNVAVGTF